MLAGLKEQVGEELYAVFIKNAYGADNEDDLDSIVLGANWDRGIARVQLKNGDVFVKACTRDDLFVLVREHVGKVATPELLEWLKGDVLAYERLREDCQRHS